MISHSITTIILDAKLELSVSIGLLRTPYKLLVALLGHVLWLWILNIVPSNIPRDVNDRAKVKIN